MARAVSYFPDSRRLLRLASALGLALCLCAAGCAAQEDGAAAPEDSAASARPVLAKKKPYQVVISGALSDSLSGSARFGLVESVSGKRQMMVIRLHEAIDFTGGVAITNGKPGLPRPGEYSLTTKAVIDSVGSDTRFAIVYRKDITRIFQSEEGALTIDVAADTMIAGRFNAKMRGTLTEGSQVLEGVELRLRGEFKARPGVAGYFIGL